MYGAEMVEEIKRLSSNIVVMPLPTLYSSLHKLATKKFVNSYWQEAEVGGRRHVYNITKAGREYYEKNKFEINYQALKENEITEHKTYSTLEEAFSLPLNNKPVVPEDKRVLKITPPAPPTTKTTPYLVPTDKITTTEVKHKQMTINLTGTVGTTDLRPLVKLNAVQAGNDFVLINKLRVFTALLTTLLFILINFLFSLMAFSKREYHGFIFITLVIYYAIILAIYIVFPKTKAMFSKDKSAKIRGLVTLALLLVVAIIAIVDQTWQLIWLGTFAFVPLVECLLMIILRKGKVFVC